jgi:archaellum biogenesis protein FlaJ (TadC family)
MEGLFLSYLTAIIVFIYSIVRGLKVDKILDERDCFVLYHIILINTYIPICLYIADIDDSGQ